MPASAAEASMLHPMHHPPEASKALYFATMQCVLQISSTSLALSW